MLLNSSSSIVVIAFCLHGKHEDNFKDSIYANNDVFELLIDSRGEQESLKVDIQ